MILKLFTIFTCDFCGKEQDEVSQMIVAGDNHTAICNECVAVCVDVIAEAVATKAA